MIKADIYFITKILDTVKDQIRVILSVIILSLIIKKYS